jgi:Ca-activated chloride channel family protein
MIVAVPVVLLLVVALPFVATWLIRHAQAARAAALATLGDPAVLERTGLRVDPRARRIRAVLRTGALAAGLLALARPQGGETDFRSNRSGRDLLVALDLSRSMLVQDAGGTRLDRARTLAKDLADELPGDRIGLVIFGGAAFLQLPLTSDHAVFDRFLDAASTNAIDDPSTDISAALDVSRTVFEHEGGDGHRAIVLLSDGERSEGNLDVPLEKLGEAHVPVFVLGVGTPEGGFVPADPDVPGDSASRWHLDNIGRPAESRLDEKTLKRIAEASGGAYARWDDRAARKDLVASIRRVAERPLGSQRVPQHVEWFQWPLGVALFLLLLEALFVPGWSRRAVPVLAAGLVLVMVGCGGERGPFRRAVRLYHSSRYPESFALYQDRLAESKDPLVNLGAGNAGYRVSRFEDAAVRLQAAATAAATPEIRTVALYNLGNAWFRSAQASKERSADFYDRAIVAYEEVLLAAPADSGARWNLELALKKRDEVESSGSPGRGGRALAGQSSGSQEGLNGEREQAIGAMAGGGSGDAAGESAEELSEEEARKLLESVERQQLTEHEGRRPKGNGGDGRDW